MDTKLMTVIFSMEVSVKFRGHNTQLTDVGVAPNNRVQGETESEASAPPTPG